MNLGISDDESSRGTGGNGGLDGEADDAAVHDLHSGELGHETLHAQAGGDGTTAIILIEPTGDGISGEGDDATAESVDLLDERGVDAIEMDGELFDASAWAERGGEGFGEGGEP